MNFRERIEIEKHLVIDLFRKHESERTPRDDFAYSIIDSLDRTNFGFYKVKLDESELRHIILPHHGHDSNIVPPGGMGILDCCAALKGRSDTNTSECLLKVLQIKTDLLASGSRSCKSFLLLSSDKETVHPRHYNTYSAEALFIANGFHRLLAVGLVYQEKGIIPIQDIFYCEPRNVA